MSSSVGAYGSFDNRGTSLSMDQDEGSSEPRSKKEEAEPLLKDSAFEIEAVDEGDGDRDKTDSTIPASSDEEVETTSLKGRRPRDDHSLSNCDTIVHLLKGNIGTGILAIPNALQNAGLIFGTGGLVLMSVTCVSCMHKLIHSSHELARRVNRRSLTYPEVAEYAFKTGGSAGRPLAHAARIIIKIFLCIAQLGFCCVYLLFIAQHLQKLFRHRFGSLNVLYYLLLLLLPTMGLCSVRNLKYLSPVSMVANLLQFLGMFLSFFYLLQDLPRDWDGDYYFSSLKQLPLYFGTAIYAFEGIGVVLPLENQMRYPQDLKGLNGVLNTSMTIVTCMYIAVGFFGYLRYGNHLDGSITLKFPENEWLSQIIFVTMCLAIFFSYALQFYVPLKTILPFVQSWVPERSHLRAEFALRYGLVILTFCCAAAIPKLDLLISLVGAVSSSTLALMAPAIIETVTFWPDMGPYKIKLWYNILVFTIGFVGFLTGTYVSIERIINGN